MKAPSLYLLITFIVYSINAFAQIGPDGTGTINGYYIGPDADLSGAPPEVLISGYYHNMVLTEQGECLAWGWGKYGQTIIDKNLSKAVSIDGGYYHSVAVNDKGSVYAWGRNNYSQISIPEINLPALQAAAGFTHTIILIEDVTLIGFGRDNYGQISIPDDL